MSFPAERLVLSEVTPEAYRAMYALSQESAKLGLEHALIELVKVRASQLNGCAFCLDMHLKDARALGEEQSRLDLLPAWREAQCYSDRERAALALTESMTLLHTDHVSDDVYSPLLELFSEREVAGLIWAITAINAWNRVAIATRMLPGHYEPRQR